MCQDCTCVCEACLFCERIEKASAAWTAKRERAHGSEQNVIISMWHVFVFTCSGKAKSDWQLLKWQRELCYLSDVTVWLFSVLVTLVKECCSVRLVIKHQCAAHSSEVFRGRCLGSCVAPSVSALKLHCLCVLRRQKYFYCHTCNCLLVLSPGDEPQHKNLAWLLQVR